MTTKNIPETNWPALNWLIDVLANNVGKVKWVKMTKEEQLEYDKKCSYNAGYPYKVVKYPIPEGKKIILKDSEKYIIKCESEDTRNLLIQLAIEYKNIEHERNYFKAEKRYDKWQEIKELPPHFSYLSSPERKGPFLVYSPILPYVNGGVTLGFRTGRKKVDGLDNGSDEKWFILIDGKEIEHPVTHYRYLPPNPINTVNYEEVKEEAEKLIKILGRESNHI